MNKTASHKLLRIVSGVLLGAAVIVLCVFARGLSAEDILRFTPENPFFAFLVMTLMTAAASMIPVFPMMIFSFACGMLFPFWGAVLTGAIGIFAETMLQYLLGRRMGSSHVDKLLARYPKLSVIRSWQVHNDVFLTYLLRVSGLPVNMVSLFVGALGVRLLPCLLGTYLGMLPGLISCILIGMQVKSEFTWQLIAMIVLINAASFVIAFGYNRHASHRKKG